MKESKEINNCTVVIVYETTHPWYFEHNCFVIK